MSMCSNNRLFVYEYLFRGSLGTLLALEMQRTFPTSDLMMKADANLAYF